MKERDVDWSEYQRSRVSFYARSSSEIYSGWLVFGKGQTIEIISRDHPAGDADDAFIFQIFGEGRDAFCVANLVTRTSSDVRIDEEETEVLQFAQKSEARYQCTRSEVRKSLHGHGASVRIGETKFDVHLQDFSASGLGFTSEHAFSAGDKGTLTFNSTGCEIEVNFVVKNVRTIPESEGGKANRVGVTMDVSDRISQVAMRKLLAS